MKTKTGINDIVLVYFEDNPLVFARIENITPDYKPNWYHVKLLLLKLPLEIVTWILRDVYIDGAGFTMNGNKMRLELVTSPDTEDNNVEPIPIKQQENDGRDQVQNKGGAKVLSFKRKKTDFEEDGE